MATIIVLFTFCSTMPHLASPFSTPLIVFPDRDQIHGCYHRRDARATRQYSDSVILPCRSSSPLIMLLLDYPYTLAQACLLPSLSAAVVSFDELPTDPRSSPRTYSLFRDPALTAVMGSSSCYRVDGLLLFLHVPAFAPYLSCTLFSRQPRSLCLCWKG
jgi:hypothetical protein